MRKREGSVVCPSCGYLVGVNDETCYNCGRRNPGLWGFASSLQRLGNINFPQVVIVTCVVLYILMLALAPDEIGGRGMLGFLSPSSVSLVVFGASGAVPVFGYDRWWTVLSASWLHAGLLHILFNMLWVRDLAPAVSSLYGSSRMVIIYIISGLVGFAASTFAGYYLAFLPSFLAGARLTVGASASIFGLLGALIYAERRGAGMFIGQQAKMWAMILFLFGLFMPGIDNWAHLGGLAGGFGVSAWLNPLKRERLEDTVGAFVLVILSAAAIVWSVITGLRLLA
ncbi:MAG: rhomboid family intramembrane serine protease [Acidobacteria bacterium]|nr:MAG: rhomboid family intramembrane serine protease [Acidobacteriota bacterium]